MSLTFNTAFIPGQGPKAAQTSPTEMRLMREALAEIERHETVAEVYRTSTTSAEKAAAVSALEQIAAMPLESDRG